MSVGGMFLFHCYLVITNQTTVEMFDNSRMKALRKRQGNMITRVIRVTTVEMFDKSRIKAVRMEELS